MVHVSWAGPEVYFPAMQSEHEEAPVWLEAFPGAQSVQFDAISNEYFPWPQAEQEMAPGEGLYVPAVQVRQSDLSPAPGSARYWRRNEG